jgi:hypothetical protein
MTGDVLYLTVIVGGLLLLLGLALLIGRVEASARDGAWRRIADARRLLHERERELLDCLNSAECRDCPSWRHLRDRHGD